MNQSEHSLKRKVNCEHTLQSEYIFQSWTFKQDGFEIYFGDKDI